MKTNKKMTLKFYQNLGKLFYAIAASDKTVRIVEVEKLKELVKNQWLDVDLIEDTFGTDAAYQIEIVFDWLNQEEFLNVESCFKDFISYKNEQAHLFTDEVKHLILRTAESIAFSFSGINKSELIMLVKLNLELNKT